MKNEQNTIDFRAPHEGKRLPKAVADGVGGMILAVAEIAAIIRTQKIIHLSNGRPEASRIPF